MSDCLFCKIRDGEIPSTQVYEDDDVLVFEDINPGAPMHVLCIPKQHVATIDDLTEETAPLVGKLFMAASHVATERGYEGAYRVVMNCGAPVGQSVFHLHLHVLAGRPLTWPPG